MKFEATKCDECGRIQGEANHWIQIVVWLTEREGCVGVALGPMVPDGLMAVSDYTSAKKESRDLCGQGCAFKHVAKLLGWSQASE